MVVPYELFDARAAEALSLSTGGVEQTVGERYDDGADHERGTLLIDRIFNVEPERPAASIELRHFAGRRTIQDRGRMTSRGIVQASARQVQHHADHRCEGLFHEPRLNQRVIAPPEDGAC